MGIRGDGNGHGNNWKLLVGLSVLCAVVVFFGGFLHRRALDSAIAERQAKSVAFVNTKVAAAAKHADLSGPMKDAQAASFTKQLDLPAGTDLRLFSTVGVPVYTSPGLAPFPADTEGIQTAASGDQGRVVDGSDLRVYAPVDGKGAKPVAIAAVVSNYVQLRNDAAGPLDAVRLPVVGLGIVLLVAGLLLMLQATKGAAAAKAPSTPAAKTRKASLSKPAASSKGRVTGFDPVPVTVGRSFEAPDEEPADAVEPVVPEPPAADAGPAPEGKTLFGLRLGSKKDKKGNRVPDEAQAPTDAAALAPDKPKRSLFARKDASTDDPGQVEPQEEKAASALEREVAIRQALEDQLEQLRTRIQMQDVETNNATKELVAQLEAANRRAEEAEARANDAGAASPVAAPAQTPASVADVAAQRVQQLDREVAEARSVTADAVARAEMLQRQLEQAQVAPPVSAADPNLEAKVAEAMGQLTDAQQRATTAEQRAAAAEQRAASVESVRDELEVRVAQLGTKASELEQRATELETSLNEANAGADAVRAEIATLTAALAAANARVTELESAPPAAARNEDDQAEIARLRGELANHMERAQAAEDRVAALEADLLAAQRGVPAIQDNGSPVSEEPRPTRSEALEEVSLASRFAPDQPEASTDEPIPTQQGSGSEPEASTTNEPPVRASELVSHEPEVREPEVREPEVREPEVREPEVREPEVRETEVREPEVREPEEVFAASTSANGDRDLMDENPVVDSAAEVSAPTPSATWSAPQPTPSSEEPKDPATVTASASAEDEHDLSEPRELEIEGRSDGSETSGAGSFEAEQMQADSPTRELAQPEVHEADPVPTDNATTEPTQPEVDEPEPVTAKIQQQQAAVWEPPQQARVEPTPAVEWHAPSSAPAVATSPSNGNGIPPAPSDDARYDDIWTAAFAPPGPKAPQGEPPAERAPTTPQAGSAEPRQQSSNGAGSARERPVNEVSPDDQASPPEDEISAEDDMWSLRARLAEAAERKRLPHDID